MANTLLKAGVLLAVIAFLYQAIISDLVFVVLGVGRTPESINTFPYQCYRIEDPRLQACEDMWLSDITRQLFLACSEPLARTQWMPNIGRFNVSGRSTSDALIALDIDKPITSSSGMRSFNYRVLKTPNFPTSPVAGDSSSSSSSNSALQLTGLTGLDSAEQINLYLVNNRPSISHSDTATFADNAAVGANSTIEHFITGPAATAMKHMRTYISRSGIVTPNNIATAPGMRGFYITNDHGGAKTGIWHTLSLYLGTGDVTFCDTSTMSTAAASEGATPVCTKLVGGLKFPNGLLFHPEQKLLYVPSAAVGNIHVYEPQYVSSAGSTVMTPRLKKVGVVRIPYPMDNLSLDPSTGDIYAAAFPSALDMIKGFDDPLGPTPPSAAVRVWKVEGEMRWGWEKVIEDRDGEVLPASTTVLRDGKTGRLFFSGVYSPFITVCNPL